MAKLKKPKNIKDFFGIVSCGFRGNNPEFTGEKMGE